MSIERIKPAIPQSRASLSLGSARRAGGTIAFEEAPVPAANARVNTIRGDDGKATTFYGDVPNSANPRSCFLDTMPEERVRKILQMVESATTFTVRDLALELRLSPSYLQRLFKHQTGLSIGEWLIEQRLQRAAHLLVHSYLSVKEIGHSIGYEHTSSFVRAFGRRFQQAPARYRKRRDGANC